MFSSSLWTNHAAKGRGGAVFNAGVAKLANTTVDGNTANKGGGIAASNQDVLQKTTLERVTNADNKAIKAEVPEGPEGPGDPGGFGGGLYIEPGALVELVSTIIAQNAAGEAGPDISGEVSSLGYNLIGNGDGGSGYDASDLVGTTEESFDPGLNPLGNYGGPTLTRTLAAWSPALNAGSYLPSDALTDQRGYDRYADGTPDIGAVEMQAADWTVVFAAVGDWVWEDFNDNGIQDFGDGRLEGVRVSLYNAGGEVVGFAVTGEEGQFELLTTVSGDYYLVFELPEGYIFAQQDQGGDDTLDSDVNAEGVTALFTLTVGTVNNDVDAGVVPV